MPKMKTNRSAAKRFKLTGSGKVMHRRQGLRHILTKKSAKRKRRLGQDAEVDTANLKAVKRLVPPKYMK
jgi:large subunit ribosomal protein L35